MDYEIKLTNNFSLYEDDIGKLVNVKLVSHQYNNCEVLKYCLITNVICNKNNFFDKDVVLLLPNKKTKTLRLNKDIRQYDISVTYLSKG